MNEKEYRKSLLKCVKRYKEMSPRGDLLDFIHLFEKGIKENLPLMKLNRWLGYIQGCLITRKFTTVDREREWTRSLFRPLDFPEIKG